jgi:hypothetical protein
MISPLRIAFSAAEVRDRGGKADALNPNGLDPDDIGCMPSAETTSRGRSAKGNAA